MVPFQVRDFSDKLTNIPRTYQAPVSPPEPNANLTLQDEHENLALVPLLENWLARVVFLHAHVADQRGQVFGLQLVKEHA